MTDPKSVRRKKLPTDQWLRANGVMLLWIAGPFLVMSLLAAMFVPESWSSASGPLSGFTAAMTMLVPSIVKYAHNSSFPGFTETYLSVVWAASIATVLVFGIRRYPLDERKKLPRKGRWLILWLYVGALVVLGLSQFVGFEYSAESLTQYSLGSVVRRAISFSKWWLALFGSALYVLTALLGILGVVGMRNFRRLWLSDL